MKSLILREEGMTIKRERYVTSSAKIERGEKDDVLVYKSYYK